MGVDGKIVGPLSLPDSFSSSRVLLSSSSGLSLLQGGQISLCHNWSKRERWKPQDEAWKSHGTTSALSYLLKQVTKERGR